MEHSEVPQGLKRVCKLVGENPEVIWTMQPPAAAGQGPMCEVINTPERVEEFNDAINRVLDCGGTPMDAMNAAGEVILGCDRPEMPPARNEGFPPDLVTVTRLVPSKPRGRTITLL